MRKTFLGCILCFAVACSTFAQTNPVISSFSQNGALTATNLEPGTVATVEWAASLAGPWSTNWAGLDAVVADGNGTIQVSVPMFYRVRGTPRLPLKIETSVTNLVLFESGNNNLQVHLTKQPAASVTVTVSSGDVTKVTASPATLTFTPANWNLDQSVTVSGVNDADTMDATVNLTLSAPGLSDKVVSVFVQDDDQALVLSTSALFLNEGSSMSLGIKLVGQPAANITANVASANTAVATVSPASLTFTPANWNTYQFVTVSGVQDVNLATGITVVQVSAGLAFNATANVTVNDDDVQAIDTAATAVTIGEGGSGTVGVRLAFQPATTVNVTASMSDVSKATAAPTILSFTPANWNVYQNVTLSGVQDADNLNESVTLSLTASGVTTSTVTVNVVDDD